MTMNMGVLAICAILALIIQKIWYHPKVFGKKWQKAAGVSEDETTQSSKLLKTVSSLILYFFLSFGVFYVTCHQSHVLALTDPDMEALKHGTAAAFLAEYGSNFLSFKHGITHGIFSCFFAFAFPFIGFVAISEKKGWDYVLINSGYWILTLILMSCIISEWGGVPVEGKDLSWFQFL